MLYVSHNCPPFSHQVNLYLLNLMSSLQFSEDESLDFSLESSGAKTPPLQRVTVTTPPSKPSAGKTTSQIATNSKINKPTQPPIDTTKSSLVPASSQSPNKALNTTTAPPQPAPSSLPPQPTTITTKPTTITTSANNNNVRRSIDDAVSNSSDALSFGDDLSSAPSESRRVSITPLQNNSVSNAAGAAMAIASPEHSQQSRLPAIPSSPTKDIIRTDNDFQNNSSATSTDFGSPYALKVTARPETAKPSTSPINRHLSQLSQQMLQQHLLQTGDAQNGNNANVSVSNELLSTFDAGSTSTPLPTSTSNPRMNANNQAGGNDTTTSSPMQSFSLAGQSQFVQSASVLKGGANGQNETTSSKNKEKGEARAISNTSEFGVDNPLDNKHKNNAVLSEPPLAVSNNAVCVGTQRLDSDEVMADAALSLPKYSVAVLDDTQSTHTNKPSRGGGVHDRAVHDQPLSSSTNTITTVNNNSTAHQRSRFGTHDTSFADQSDYTAPSARPGTAKPTTATADTATNLTSTTPSQNAASATKRSTNRSEDEGDAATTVTSELSLEPATDDRSISLSMSQVATPLLRSEAAVKQQFCGSVSSSPITGASPTRPLPRAPTPNKQQQDATSLKKPLDATISSPPQPSKSPTRSKVSTGEDEDVDLSDDEEDDVKTGSAASDNVPTTANTPKEGALQGIPEVRMKGATAVSALVLAHTTLTAEEFMRIQNMYQEYKHGLQTGEASDREELANTETVQFEKLLKLQAKELKLVEELLAQRAHDEALRQWEAQTAIVHAKEQEDLAAEALSTSKNLFNDETAAFKTLIGEAGSEISNYYARRDVEEEETKKRESEIFAEDQAWRDSLEWCRKCSNVIERKAIELAESDDRTSELLAPELEEWKALMEKHTSRWSQIITRAKIWRDDINAREEQQRLEDRHSNQNFDLCEIREPRARNIISQTERVERHAIRRIFQARKAEIQAADEEAELYRTAAQYVIDEINEVVSAEEERRMNIKQTYSLLLTAKQYAFSSERSKLQLQLCEQEEARARVQLAAAFLVGSSDLSENSDLSHQQTSNEVNEESEVGIYLLWQDLNLARSAAYTNRLSERMKNEGKIVHHFSSAKYEIFAFEDSQRRVIAINEDSYFSNMFGENRTLNTSSVNNDEGNGNRCSSSLFAKATQIALFCETESAYRTPITKEWIHSCWGITKAAQRLHKRAQDEIKAREVFVSEYANRLTRLSGEGENTNRTDSQKPISNIIFGSSPLLLSDKQNIIFSASFQRNEDKSASSEVQNEIELQYKRASEVLVPKPPSTHRPTAVPTSRTSINNDDETYQKAERNAKIAAIIRDYDNGISAPGTLMRGYQPPSPLSPDSGIGTDQLPLRPQRPTSSKDGGRRTGALAALAVPTDQQLIAAAVMDTDDLTKITKVIKLRAAVTEEDENRKRQQMIADYTSERSQLFHMFDAMIITNTHHHQYSRVGNFVSVGSTPNTPTPYPWDTQPPQIRPIAKLLPNPLF